jgi:hypothetical protein
MKKFLPILIAVLVIGGAAFYGGTQYTKAKQPARGNFTRLGQGTGMEALGAGATGGANMRGTGAGGGFVSGEILSKDDKSVTVKLRDGGSKIIFFSGSTKITKTVDGSLEDLKVGESISATGSANTDGSVTAQSFQLRPNLPAPVPAAK